MEDSRNWVTVAAFIAPWMAHLARARLEADGIECELGDEHTANLDWAYANAIGGVKLRVHPKDARAAHEILGTAAEIPVFENDGDPEDVAPQDRAPKDGASQPHPVAATPGKRRPANSRVAGGGRRTLGAQRLTQPFEGGDTKEPGSAGPAGSSAKPQMCPDCHGQRLEREGSRFRDLIAAFIGAGKRTWRCLNCGRRFSEDSSPA